MSYTYDSTTLRRTATHTANGPRVDTTYYPTGKPAAHDIHGGNGPVVRATYEYEWGTQRLTATAVQRWEEAFDRRETYRYDQAGNILSIADVSATGTDVQCFQYDYLRRLTEAWAQSTATCTETPTPDHMGGPAPYWHSYTYDLAGNRLTETLHEQDTERTYAYPEPGTSQPHTLTSVIEEAPGIRSLEEYAYDASGNTTARQTGGDTQELTWDAEGRLARVEEANGAATEYLYDADGNRLIARTPTGTTLYLGDHTEITLPAGSTTPLATRYIDLGGGHTAVLADDESVSITMADHHGTGQLAIDTDTLELTQRRTLPFGNLRGDTPDTWAGSRGFVGGTTDTTTGLTQLGARAYDPDLGRFLSLDPVMDLTDPQQIHGYTYANNNPVTYSDPTGLFFGGLFDKIGQTARNITRAAQQAIGSYRPGGGNRATSNQGGTTTTRISWPADARDQCTTAVPCARPGESESRWQAEEQRRQSSLVDQALGLFTSSFLPDPGTWQNCIEGSAEDCAWAATDLPWAKVLHIADAVSDVARNTARRADRCADSNSFLPETHVLMADGTTKAIEDLEIGEQVLAADPTTGEVGPRTVTAELVNTGTKQLTTLTVTDPQGNQHTLTSTAEHPYWAPDTGQWLDAADLTPGTQLHTDNGTQVGITATHHFSTQATVHNLTIEGLHTYHVLAGSTPVLVHNCTIAPNLHHLPTPQEAQDIIQNAPRGSSAANKSDPYHRAPIYVQDQIAEHGTVWRQAQRDPMNPDTMLHVSVPGEVNGKSGLFHWIVDPQGILVHEAFEPRR